jgi:hypothetical protein
MYMAPFSCWFKPQTVGISIFYLFKYARTILLLLNYHETMYDLCVIILQQTKIGCF